MNQNVEPPIALITGAGSGIGKAVCHRLDKLGYSLIVSGSNQNKLDKLASQLQTTPHIEVADLSNSQDLCGLCNSLGSKYPALDIVFANAGMIGIGHFSERDTMSVDQELDVNLRSVLHIINACLPNMRAAKKGHIVATSSIGGIMSLQGSSVYSATKFALRGFLAALQQELATDNIKVSGVYPGAIDTPMLRHEACHGGSSLNFIQQPSSVDEVADSFMRALHTGKLENYVPYGDSVLARFLSVFPWITPKILPFLEKAGEKGRQKFIAAHGLDKATAKPH